MATGARFLPVSSGETDQQELLAASSSATYLVLIPISLKSSPKIVTVEYRLFSIPYSALQ